MSAPTPQPEICGKNGFAHQPLDTISTRLQDTSPTPPHHPPSSPSITTPDLPPSNKPADPSRLTGDLSQNSSDQIVASRGEISSPSTASSEERAPTRSCAAPPPCRPPAAAPASSDHAAATPWQRGRGMAHQYHCDHHDGRTLLDLSARSATSYHQVYDITPPVSLNQILAERETSCLADPGYDRDTTSSYSRSGDAKLPTRDPGYDRDKARCISGGGDDQLLSKDSARRLLIGGDGHVGDGEGEGGEDAASLLKEYHEQQLRFLASMGNGASGNTVCSSNRVSDSGQDVKALSKESLKDAKALGRDSADLEKALAIHGDYEYLKGLLPQLKKENKEWEEKCCCWETQVAELKRQLKAKEQEVVKLQREVHKLKSVLQQATSFSQQDGGDLLSSLQDQHGMAGQPQQQQQQQEQPLNGGARASLNAPGGGGGPGCTLKKQGVSGESSEAGQMAEDILIQTHEKDFRSKQLIKDAIMDNDFLKNLDSSQVREVVDSMYPTEYERGSYVINEGEAGSHLYVAAEGEFEVVKEDKVLGRMGAGKAFGELAILYNCTRTASIRVVSDSKVWVLDRRVFQRIMMRTGLQRSEDNVNFLRSVPLLANLSREVLAKMADVMEVEFYPAGAYIVRQGAHGDTFFIISQGGVKVTQRLPGRRDEEEIRTLERGDYFGEQALLKEDCRTATIIAQAPGVECLTLDRESFTQLIGDLSELHEKDYGDESRGLSRPASSFSINDSDQEFDFIRLDDLDVIATLGVGGFGRVELVQYRYDKTQTYALKCLKKRHIVDTQQQEHVFSEKAIMLGCRSPFICRLYRTFKDTKYVYMLLEACLGGEVWTILRDRGHFEDSTTRFVTACVVEAFEYLHARGIIYRDLKPENLLLDSQGYVKLVDFGFSKRLGYSSKTWTFCGTPEYVAPEIILNKGHDRAVDYWSLGVLMHELLTGTPPFTATDPMKTYNIILKGIDMINFPRHISRTAQSLIKKLCRDAPSERLGYQRGGISDIKKNKWFQGFDWDGLKQRSLTGPILPQVKSPTDTSNFDAYPKDADSAPEEFSNWELEF